ncbi:conjugal transfer protein [Chitinimonas arctica]|uniref:Conjugal transfer protein n=1 Tax=Chitinimonas arctica TaxID=2594795 RepID=A0A516SHD1_9NEIS|nr:VirB8/TrbF family protein [Chitinimonas arctica]QDQ27571.1 conjugal transfer protein [Chitinimonas arctica]
MSLKQLASNLLSGKGQPESVMAAPTHQSGNGKRPASESNPYAEARREWNERYGDYIKQAHNWRLCALISGLVALVAVIGLAYVGAQNKIVPYVVQVDKFGAAVAVGPADKAAATDEKVVKAYLARFISDWRSVTVDQVAEKSAIERVYSMLASGSPALTKLNEHFKANNPFLVSEKMMISVEVTSVLPISERTWQLEWTEVTRDLKGELKSNQRMRASIIVEITPPQDERLFLINPIGVYATDLNWVQSL